MSKLLFEPNMDKNDPFLRQSKLSTAKQAILTKRLRGELKGSQAIPRSASSGPAPLSFAQQRLWFLDQLEPGSPAYNIPAAVRLRGPLNVTALEKSVNEVVRRHESLRTTFAAKDGQPVQVVSPYHPFTLSLVDLQALSETEREAKVQRLANEEAQRPFNLAQGPLIRTTLLQLNEEEHVFLLTIHHIVSDGWSIGIFIQEMTALYEAFSTGKPSPLPELPVQYADFTYWQRDWLRGEVLEEQLSYWKQQLAGVSVLRLPIDRPRLAVQTFRGAQETLILPKSLTEALTAASAQA